MITQSAQPFKSALIPEHYWAVNLLDDDIRFIEDAANKRRAFARQNGFHDRGTADGFSDDVVGLAGEIAISILLSRPISRITGTVSELASGDVGAKIEVKTRKLKDPRRWDMAVNLDQLKHDRAYFLCLAFDYPHFIYIAGWATGQKIERLSTRNSHANNRHPILILDRKHLNSVESFFSQLPKYI